MKARVPFKKWVVTQRFAQNLNSYYKEGGFAGHQGLDIVAVGDDTILNAIDDAYCYSVVNKDNPDLMRYRAVYTLVEIDGLYFEISYGHLDKIFAEVGQTLRLGEAIGLQGNTGDVAVGGKKVTLAEKQGGSQKGEHLHWQFRLVKPVVVKDRKKHYLQDANGTFKKDHQYYEIVDYTNGFNGCVDGSPYIEWASANNVINSIINSITNAPKEKVTKTLKYGSNGQQVKTLQKVLGITQDGSFGVATDRAVRQFQKENGLVQDGIVGEKTRQKLYI